MKTILSILVGAALLPASAVAQSAAPPPPATTGKVLVLENENTLTGDIDRVGRQYRIRRKLGETWVPAERALYLCASVEEAYAFVRGRANLEDPDERLRLARWCRTNGLRAQALVEAKAAVELRPQHRESRRLLTMLEQSSVSATPAPRPAEPEGPPPNIDLTAECLGTFVTRVQPVLMNTCARCHTLEHQGAFRLNHSYDGLADRKGLQQNLAAVLAQVNFAQPQLSPLLTKAVSDHARTGQAPLRGRQVAAYHLLEDWVRLTQENNPQLREATAPAAVPPPGPRAETAFGQDTAAAPAAAPPPAPAAAAKAPASAAPKPPAAPDPYDPEDFNRLAHPDRPRGR
jgi:hypothetical protein